jgi:hypothetical protein
MTFDNYKSIIGHGDNWHYFSPIFGSNRIRVSAKLQQLCDLRNDLFHFKRELTLQDHEALTEHRNWILLQAIKVDLRRGKDGEHI